MALYLTNYIKISLLLQKRNHNSITYNIQFKIILPIKQYNVDDINSIKCHIIKIIKMSFSSQVITSTY